MSHTYAQNVVHVVFSTKVRHKAIDHTFHPKLWAYITGICRKLDIYLHAVGGMSDHLHLLIQIPPVLTLSKVVATINQIPRDGLLNKATSLRGKKVMEHSA